MNNHRVLDIDVRGLEPPQPLIRVLQALADLHEGEELRARTDSQPVHLLPLLADRGYVGETQEQIDGSFVTRIHLG